MKLCRAGIAGQEVPAILDENGVPRSLAGIIKDFDEQAMADNFAAIRGVKIETLPGLDGARIGPCLPQPSKIVCVGLNYAAHARESKMDAPKEPVLFLKACDVTGAFDDIVIPPGADKLDWEVELAVVIGREAYRVDEKNSLDYIAGYCIMDDISERAYQHDRGGQWVKGKSLPGSAPIGPWFVTKDDVSDPGNLELGTRVNGATYQNSSTSDLIFPVPYLVAYVSQFMKLNPGDLISTGTPQGVGAALKPPKFLRPNDEVEVFVQGLGIQRHKFVGWEAGKSQE